MTWSVKAPSVKIEIKVWDRGKAPVDKYTADVLDMNVVADLELVFVLHLVGESLDLLTATIDRLSRIFFGLK